MTNDFLLQSLVDQAHDQTNEVRLVITLPGAVATGTLTDSAGWLDALETHAGSAGEDAVSALRARTAAVSAAPGGAAELKSLNAPFIHLVDARLSTTGQGREGPWRCRLEDVTAWSIHTD